MTIPEKNAIIDLIGKQKEGIGLRTIARTICESLGENTPEQIDSTYDELERAIIESGNLMMMQKYNVGWQWEGFEINGDLAVKNI